MPFIKDSEARAACTRGRCSAAAVALAPAAPSCGASPANGVNSVVDESPRHPGGMESLSFSGPELHALAQAKSKDQDNRIDSLEGKVNLILSSLQNLTESLRPETVKARMGPQQPTHRNSALFHQMDASRNYRELVNPEYLLNASSPVGLVRKIEDRMYGKRLDLSSNIRSLGDVVSHGFISEGTAMDLIEAFWTHYSPWVEGFLPEKHCWRNIRQKSSLLFSVCCMLASRYDKTISISTVKLMYDLVRQVIGLTLVNAPYFTFESLVAFYLTSLWAPTLLTEIPVDSWSMTLQALNQCVLADQIKFSRYHASHVASQAQVSWYRLWNALILNHVQWTIATSRPFSIPEYYISQCMKIYEFPDITLRDKLTIADVYLYRRLIKLTWENRVILPTDGLKIDLVEEWKNEFVELYNSNNKIFMFRYNFAYTVIFRTYLRQESGKKEDVEPGLQTATTKGDGSLETAVAAESELAVNGKSHRLAKECVVIALIHHAVTILDFFNKEPCYDPHVIDIPDYDMFIIIYCAMTLCEISMLLWKKVNKNLWHGPFVCKSVEEYYERSVDKLRYCYQDDSINVTPSRVRDTIFETVETLRAYSFNEGHVCAQFGSILEELIRKTEGAFDATGSHPSPAPTPQSTAHTPILRSYSMAENSSIHSVSKATSYATGYNPHPQILHPGVPESAGTPKVPVSNFHSNSGSTPQSNAPGNTFPWSNEESSDHAQDFSKFSPMDSYESFYIADDADVFKKIFPGGLLTLDNMN